MRLSDFELFCERHQSGMFYIACNVLGDSQKAEDAVQEALFRIYRTFGKLSFRTVREERVYALRAAKNAAIDLLRQNKPCETLDDISMDRLSMERGDTTYSAAAAHSTEEYVGRFIQALPEKTKAIFSYRSLGLSDKEIAETLSITPDNVRTIAFRARMYGDNVFEKHGINRDRTGDGEKPRCLCGKRGIFNRDGAANYQTT